jgi:ketosteroid isomerase-like protein
VSQNVEMVRRTFDAMCRGDYREAVRGFQDDAVWHNTSEFPGEASCVGPQAIVKFWTALMENVEEGNMDVQRAVEGGDAVVLGVRSVGRARASGVPFDVSWSAAFRVLDGKISRVDVHGSWEKALEAVGL